MKSQQTVRNHNRKLVSVEADISRNRNVGEGGCMLYACVSDRSAAQIIAI